LYEFDGARVTGLAMAKVHRWFNPAPGETAYWAATRYANAALAYHKGTNQVWLALSRYGVSVNDRILVLQAGVDARYTMYDHPAIALAYASGVEDTTDVPYLYGIDRFGFLWRYDSGTNDGVPSGTVTGTVTAATANTLTDSAATFYTTGDDLIGCQVRIVSGTGVGQTRYITANTGTELTVESNWATNPSTDSTYRVGGVDREVQFQIERHVREAEEAVGEWYGHTTPAPVAAASVFRRRNCRRGGARAAPRTSAGSSSAPGDGSLDSAG
jgi:hypothetical protein